MQEDVQVPLANRLPAPAFRFVESVPAGKVPVDTHAEVQFAYCELQVIIQVSTPEVCASLIFSLADALSANPSIANTVSRVGSARMIALRITW